MIGQYLSTSNDFNLVKDEKLHNIDKNDVTAVIPTLNEELAIPLVLADLIIEGYNKILVVDGNSNDNTVNIAKVS